MKVLILAGGVGSRLSEETRLIPKPMVEIGGKPILWHVMKIYSYYGFNDFVILTGYKSHVIKDYFVNYYQRYSDITVDLSDNSVEILRNQIEPWRVTIVYTGEKALTGSRIKKAKNYINNERFMLTYGDGVGDVNISELIKSHEKSKKLCTITSVQPRGRFGALDISDDNTILTFSEKPKEENTWINGGFMVMEPKVLDYIEDDKDDITFEETPLKNIALEGQLHAYKHHGFWKAMDNLKDKIDLTALWQNGKAPWAIWQKDNK